MTAFECIEDIYKFYNQHTKDAIGAIQAAGTEFPTEFLIEIYAAFDDMKLFFSENNTKDDIPKVHKEVLSHLKRATLDCYKSYLLMFNEDMQNLCKSYNLTLLDNGGYYPKFMSEKQIITAKALYARAKNTNMTVDEEFELWKEIYMLIAEFRQTMVNNRKKDIEWAANREFISRTTLFAIILAFCVLIMFGEPIYDMVQNIRTVIITTFIPSLLLSVLGNWVYDIVRKKFLKQK